MEINEKYPEKLKCCVCGVVMDKIYTSIGECDYKCRNNKCSTYEK